MQRSTAWAIGALPLAGTPAADPTAELRVASPDVTDTDAQAHAGRRGRIRPAVRRRGVFPRRQHKGAPKR